MRSTDAAFLVGLAAARPAAAAKPATPQHAQHMPGHIWAQTGKWEEAAQSFEAAAENERGYMKADKLYSKGHHDHNAHFLITSYCFHGKYDKAMDAAHELLGIAENPREAAAIDNWYSPHRQGWFGLMKTLVHFEEWDEILDGKTPVIYDKPREQAWRHWAMGLALASKGDARAAGAACGAPGTGRPDRPRGEENRQIAADDASRGSRREGFALHRAALLSAAGIRSPRTHFVRRWSNIRRAIAP